MNGYEMERQNDGRDEEGGVRDEWGADINRA